MIFGWNKGVSKKVTKFETDKISRNGLKQLFYNNQYETMQIWGKTSGKTKNSRTLSGEEVFSVFGPGRKAMNGAEYWKNGFGGTTNGYIILYDVNKTGFRVFSIDDIDKVKFRDVEYTLR